MAIDPTRVLLDQIRGLPASRQRELLLEIQRLLTTNSSGQNNSGQKAPRILDLRGLGKDIWADVDVEKYLNKERDTWDG